MLYHFINTSVLLFLLCIYTGENHHNRHRRKSHKRNSTSQCYEELGCVDTTNDWYNKTYRPTNVPPLERHTIHTSFLLFSACLQNDDSEPNETPLAFEEIWAGNKSIAMSNYDRTKGLQILIHDFSSHGYTGWIKHLALVLLSQNHTIHNVMSVNWESGAEPPMIQAAANARVVALEIAALLKCLKDNFKLKESRVHLIGHGMGAHIAGYVGAKVVGIGRITGLDPTGPLFEHMPAVVRLDPSDASYVEVVHTDSISQNNYYVNNGRYQPGCNETNNYTDVAKVDRNSLKEGVIYPGCSHKRGFKYYIEACACSSCEFIAYVCDSFASYKQGKCFNCFGPNDKLVCRKMGLMEPVYTGNRTGHVVYLVTSPQAPYCMHMYGVRIRFANPLHCKKTITGLFEMMIVGENGALEVAIFNHDEYARTLEHGKNMTFLASSGPRGVDKIIEIRLRWKHTPNPWCVMCNNAAYVYNMTIWSLRYPDENGWLPPRNEICSRTANMTEIRDASVGQFIRCDIHDLQELNIEDDTSNLRDYI